VILRVSCKLMLMMTPDVRLLASTANMPHLPRKVKHSSNSGGASSTVWYVNVFLYSAGQVGTVCRAQQRVSSSSSAACSHTRSWTVLHTPYVEYVSDPHCLEQLLP
jgi:hypothetical protein